MREVHFHQYIRNNPKKWTSDRWGAVTENMLGDISPNGMLAMMMTELNSQAQLRN